MNDTTYIQPTAIATQTTEGDAGVPKNSSPFSWKVRNDRRNRDALWTREKLEDLALDWFLRKFVCRYGNDHLGREPELTRMKTLSRNGIVDFRALEELAIRWTVKNFILPRYDEEIHEEDAVVLLSLLVETGTVDHPALFTGKFVEAGTECPSGLLWLDGDPDWDWHHLENAFDPPTKLAGIDCYLEGIDSAFLPYPRKLPFITNNDGRIATVYIGSPSRYDNEEELQAWTHKWNFHTPRVFELLAKLDKMETLILQGCTSFALSRTISSFPNLKVVSVSRSDRRSKLDPCDIGCRCCFTMSHNASKLEVLHLDHRCFSCELLEMLLGSLRNYPKVSTLAIEASGISFLPIADAIVKKELSSYSRLRRLYLGVDGVYLEKGDGSKEEIVAIKTILREFKELETIHGTVAEWEDKELQHLLNMNRAGRVLVETKETTKNKNNSEEDAKRNCKALPSSVWPIILERVSKETKGKKQNPDGLYYLLRNMPVLQDAGKREPLLRQSKSCAEDR